MVLNGHPVNRLPNTLNISVIDQLGTQLLDKVPEIAASTGSACHAGINKMSPVLKAMNLNEYAAEVHAANQSLGCPCLPGLRPAGRVLFLLV
jgi:cysteine sulfinate desulfinase/cysteine desulfurase-like protein